MFVVIWEYQVRPGSEAAFERLYGAGGGWVALFRQYAGFLATELLHDERPGYYLSIDRWRSAQDYDAFLTAAAARYAALDAEGDALTLEERRIGRYLV
jgi:heme-degrading monooxygenase HmoA